MRTRIYTDRESLERLEQFMRPSERFIVTELFDKGVRHLLLRMEGRPVDEWPLLIAREWILPMRLNERGRPEYEIEPGRWVSRQRISQLRNRQASQARHLLQQALRKGQIKRGACEVCGQPKAEAHHVDYSRPYDVQWLCRKHHGQAGPRPKQLFGKPIEPVTSKRRRGLLREHFERTRDLTVQST